MNTTRRDLLGLVGVFGLLASIGAARAQPFPTRPVHWIVPFPAGGPSDILARLIGHTLTEQLRQPFVIENRVGAGGNIGTQAVATAPADGHTLLLVAAPNAINTALYEHSGFQFRSRYCAGRQHRPRSADHAGGAIVSCRHGRAIHRSCEGQPRKVQYGIRRQRYAASRGGRTLQNHDRHRDAARPVSRRRARGHGFARRPGACVVRPHAVIHWICSSRQTWALAVTTAQRSELLPDTPSLAEFVPGYEASTWFGIGAPSATPADIVAKLNAATNAAIAEPAMKARLADLGASIFVSSPSEFKAFIAAEIEKWTQVVKAAGIKPA